MKKIVLAYSGGLDTSIILRWLQENYKAEVIAYTSDIGQEINRKKIITNAKRLGVKNIIIEDLKNIFVKDYVFPMIRAHAVYEGVYLLGTSIARPLIAKRQIAIAKKFIKLMKKATNLIVKARTAKGAETTDHYSMMGFTKAYNTAKKTCG